MVAEGKVEFGFGVEMKEKMLRSAGVEVVTSHTHAHLLQPRTRCTAHNKNYLIICLYILSWTESSAERGIYM